MPKAPRKPHAHPAKVPSGVEGALTLWGRGNNKAARAAARELLRGDVAETDRARLERLLQDTAPDSRARQIAVFAIAVVVLVILLTKLLD